MSNDDLVDLAARGVAIKNQIAELTEQLDAIKSEFRAQIHQGAKDFGEVTVTVRPSYRWDEKLAAEQIPVPFLDLVTSTVIDRAKAKENLPPAIYRACQSESTPQVLFALADEGRHRK